MLMPELSRKPSTSHPLSPLHRLNLCFQVKTPPKQLIPIKVARKRRWLPLTRRTKSCPTQVCYASIFLLLILTYGTPQNYVNVSITATIPTIPPMDSVVDIHSNKVAGTHSCFSKTVDNLEARAAVDRSNSISLMGTNSSYNERSLYSALYFVHYMHHITSYKTMSYFFLNHYAPKQIELFGLNGKISVTPPS